MSHDVKTLCPYCGVGCGLIATTDGRRVLRVRPDPHHPANLGRICPKGGTVAQTVNVATRLRHAMLRDDDGRLGVVTNGHAANVAASRLLDIIERHGPSSVAFYLSGQLTTESQYLANKFAKGVLGTNHVDSNSRLCMSSAAAGMAWSFGSDGPPTIYADIDLADAFFFVGSNAAECHPVTFERVVDRTRDRGASCVVIDPRRTPTAEHADVHLPVRPGYDLLLLTALLRLVRDEGATDHAFLAAHTEGWEDLNALLDTTDPDAAAVTCGVDPVGLRRAASLFANAQRPITFWTMGVNQSTQGTHTVNAICNLHLATGKIGKPGCGPFSLTGQPNAMGGRDVGYMSHALPGQRFVADASDRADIEALWHLPPGTIGATPGYDAVRLFDAMARGEVKALWVIGSNPAASMPRLSRVREGLERADLVIVQDAYYPTETTRYAHVLLPGAINLEQDGTFCNSERRVTLMRQVVPPPGDARPDWWWVREIARAMRRSEGVDFPNAAAIFDDFARCTVGRANDQGGLSHRLLADEGPQLWPTPSPGVTIERRYTDGVFPTPTGRARLLARVPLPPDEPADAMYPLVLTTGRVLNQWHTRTKTGLVDQLNTLDPTPYAQMHPHDAAELGLADEQAVEVVTRRGVARSTLRIDDAISPGVVFMPIHWNELFAPAASPNEATSDATDPISKQPALKACAAAVRAIGAADEFPVQRPIASRAVAPTS